MSPVLRWGLFWLCCLCAASMLTIAWESGKQQWLALAIVAVLGTYLGFFAAAWRSAGQALPRWTTLLEGFRAVPDWAVRLVGLSGAAALFAGLLLKSRLGFEEFFAPAAAVGWALVGLVWLAGPRPFRFRRDQG